MSHRRAARKRQPDSMTIAGTIFLITGVLMLVTAGGIFVIGVAQRPDLQAQIIQMAGLGTATPAPITPIIPTAPPTPRPTGTSTPVTPTKTPAPTRTPRPTITLTPSNTPLTTDTPVITFTSPPRTRWPPTGIPTERPPYHARISWVGSHLRAVYLLGQQMGNSPRSFSKIGDSESWSPRFMHAFASSDYDLGQFGYLQGVIDNFKGSFNRVGLAAYPGFISAAILDPQWADAAVCEAGETPLACELRDNKPAIALIMLRTWSTDADQDSQYYYDLRAVVEYSLDHGVIPVLSTLPWEYPPWPPSEPMNATIRLVAAEYHVPLWDLWETTQTLPGYGVDEATNHLSIPPGDFVGYFSETNLAYGTVRRNLEALQVLHEIYTGVMY